MTGRVLVTHEEWVESFTAEKYILNELSTGQRDEFEEHYFDCPECAESVRLLSQLKTGAHLALSRQTAAVQAENPRSSWIPQWLSWWVGPQPALAGALAAFCLAGVTGYQNAQLKNQLRPQMVQSIILLPATRGELPTVHTTASGQFVLLEADVPSASGNLTWELHSSSSKLVAGGRGPAPDPGLSFKVMLPTAQIAADEYKLVVRSDAGREWLFKFRAGPR